MSLFDKFVNPPVREGIIEEYVLNPSQLLEFLQLERNENGVHKYIGGCVNAVNEATIQFSAFYLRIHDSTFHRLDFEISNHSQVCASDLNRDGATLTRVEFLPVSKDISKIV